MERFGNVVLILGIVVLLYGGIQWISNQPENDEKLSGPNYGGRAGVRYRLEEEEARRSGKQRDAIKIFFAGVIVASVGASISRSVNKKA